MDIIGLKSSFISQHINKILQSGKNDCKSKADIARALGVKPQYLNSVLNGNRNVSDKFIKKFIEVFGINPNDLEEIKLGEEMFMASIPKKVECKSCLEKDRLIDRLNNQLDRNEKEIDRLNSQLESFISTKAKRHSA